MAGEEVEEGVDFLVRSDLLSLLLLGLLHVSGVTSSFPGDFGSGDALNLVRLGLGEDNSELVALNFEVLVLLEVHGDGEALIFSVEDGLNVVAVSDNGAIFVCNMFHHTSVGLQNSRPEICDTLGGALDGLHVTRLVNLNLSELLILELLLTELVLL